MSWDSLRNLLCPLYPLRELRVDSSYLRIFEGMAFCSLLFPFLIQSQSPRMVPNQSCLLVFMPLSTPLLCLIWADLMIHCKRSYVSLGSSHRCALVSPQPPCKRSSYPTEATGRDQVERSHGELRIHVEEKGPAGHLHSWAQSSCLLPVYHSTTYATMPIGAL